MAKRQKIFAQDIMIYHLIIIIFVVMKQHIVVILTALLLQLMAVACSSASSTARTHTVCPEAAMTLTDNDNESQQTQISDQRLIDLQAANIGNSGFEVYTAQSQSQIRVNQWQWQRILRDKVKSILSSNSLSAQVAMTSFRHQCIEPCSQSGYVYIIRHIII